MNPIHFAQHITSSSATGYKPFSGLFRFVGRWSVRLFLVRPTFLLPSGIYPWTSLRITNLKDAGSIPDGVIGIFHWHTPSVPTMALGSAQHLPEMSTSNISRVVNAAGA